MTQSDSSPLNPLIVACRSFPARSRGSRPNASQATGINDKEQIVGWAQDAGGSWKAFYLTKAGDPLEPLQFGADVAASMATGLGPASAYEPEGYAVGWALMPEGFDAFLYNPNWEETQLFGTQLGSQAAATCINAYQQVTGWYLTGDGLSRAFVRWGGGVPQDLAALVDNPPPGDSLMIATGINDSGWIVGQTLEGKPFLLTPKP